MEEVYAVAIEYYRKEMFGEKLEKRDVKVFTTEELAEKFLIKNGFVYGCPNPFKCYRLVL